jgi:hypothetical protein
LNNSQPDHKGGSKMVNKQVKIKKEVLTEFNQIDQEQYNEWGTIESIDKYEDGWAVYNIFINSLITGKHRIIGLQRKDFVIPR